MQKLKTKKHKKYKKHNIHTKRKTLKPNNKLMTTQQPNYSKDVSEPWFTLISLGLKTVE